MKEYLTIGEVARIKKVSIKSLRYYEHIGILIPEKINPENGYRYYSREQLFNCGYDQISGVYGHSAAPVE